MARKRVKHHGLAQLLLMAVLLLLSYALFGQGLVAAGAGLGSQALILLGAPDAGGAYAFAGGLAAFLGALLLYYAVSAVLILLYNLLR